MFSHMHRFDGTSYPGKVGQYHMILNFANYWIVMRRFEVGDPVRIDIPDRNDPDFQYHNLTEEVVDVIEDAAGRDTGDVRDSHLFRIEFDDGQKADFRGRDLRPI